MTDFNGRIKRLSATATHGRVGIRNFEKFFPAIASQVRDDAKASCCELWGLSVNLDELQNQRIVDAKILSAIGRLANFPIRHCRGVYNAGLMHTYGYLLSCLKTQYGYKRERWTRREIETAIGLPANLLSSNPKFGTLLQNTTYVLARIAFQVGSQTKSLAQKKQMHSNLKQRFPNLAPNLPGFNFDQLAVTRITEMIKVPAKLNDKKNNGRIRKAKVELLTDIVEQKRAGKANSPPRATLVYSYRVGSKQRLVTCFPVTKRTVAEMIDVARKNEIPIRARFNLYLEGMPREGLAGVRKVEKRRLE
jgi:hypothetical protein